jgi:hypothetical protein
MAKSAARPNERVKTALCIDNKTTPSYLSTRIWASMPPRRSQNSAAFSAGWARVVGDQVESMIPRSGQRFSEKIMANQTALGRTPMLRRMMR